jgi:hypothetical protein
MEHQAIYNTHSSVKVIRSEVAYDSDNNEVILDQSLVDAELTRLQAEQDSTQYQRDRATEYPAIADQLDDIFHNGIDGWKATIQLTKDKYPKGGN